MLLILVTECLEEGVFHCMRSVRGVCVAGFADEDGLVNEATLHVVVKVPRQHAPAPVRPAPEVKIVHGIVPRAHPVAHGDVAHQCVHVPVFLKPLAELGAVVLVLGQAVNQFLQLAVALPVLVLGGVNPLVTLQRCPAVPGRQLAPVAAAVRAEVLQDTAGLEYVAVRLQLGAGVAAHLILVIALKHPVVVILHEQAAHLTLIDGDIDPLGVRGGQPKRAI